VQFVSERREAIRRNVDGSIDQRLQVLESELESLDNWIHHELSDIDQRIDDRIGKTEMNIAERVAGLAVKRAFSHLGVDVDDAKNLQTFRDDLRFGGVFRSAVQKGFFAMFAAICGGIGVSIWLIFRERIGLP
jgi:hypothetical protein